MYYIVCLVKCRRLVITEEVDNVLKSVCIEISKRYKIRFLETGAEADHVDFLVQSVPTYSPTMTAAKIKSITAREIFAKVPSVRKKLRGRRVLDKSANMQMKMLLRHHVRNQGRAGKYKPLHKQNVVHHEQLTLF